MTFAKIRCAIDILRGRIPGALAMLKANDIAISIHHKGNSHCCQVWFWFDDPADCGNAYHAIERLYGLNCMQSKEKYRQFNKPTPLASDGGER